MKLPPVRALFVSVAGALLLQYAHAGLISLDSVHGASTVTLDSSTGFRWLDPEVTEGLSYIDISGLLATDPRFTGYRFAKLSELEQLFANALIPDINVPGYGALYGTTANVPGARFLQSHLGITHSYQYAADGFAFETAGFLDEPFLNPVNGYVSAYIGNVAIRTGVQTAAGKLDFASAYSAWGSVPNGSKLDGVGAWLVQPNAISTPSTLSIVALSLALLIAGRRDSMDA